MKGCLIALVAPCISGHNNTPPISACHCNAHSWVDNYRFKLICSRFAVFSVHHLYIASHLKSVCHVAAVAAFIRAGLARRCSDQARVIRWGASAALWINCSDLFHWISCFTERPIYPCSHQCSLSFRFSLFLMFLLPFQPAQALQGTQSV